MQRIIKGQNKLSGSIKISGSKCKLPILAATILSENALIKNIPSVKDIFTMIEFKLIGLKCKFSKDKKSVKIKNNNNKINTVALKLVKTMRAVFGPRPFTCKIKKAKFFTRRMCDWN